MRPAHQIAAHQLPAPHLIAPFGAETVFRAVVAVESAVLSLRTAWRQARARAAVAHLPEHLRRDIGVDL